MDDDKVKRLPIKFKTPTSDKAMLKVITSYASSKECNHTDSSIRRIQYLLRKGETEVECGACGAKLDPMFVLLILAHKENQWIETRKLYQEEMERLKKRSRTKCQHCGEMTRISHS